MIRRETLIDALVLATLAAAAYAEWCALPGDAMATEIRPAPENTPADRIAALFMIGLAMSVGFCLALYGWALSWLGCASLSTADEDEPAPDASIERRARNAEGM